MSYSSGNSENKYLLTQALGNFIVDPAYLATIAFLQNPDLSDVTCQQYYYNMVDSIDSFLFGINALPQYSSCPVAVQIGLADGNMQYNSSSINTVENVSDGKLGNLSSRPEYAVAIEQSLERVYTGLDYDVYPSPLAPLPVPGDLVFSSRYSASTPVFKNYVAQAISGKFTTNGGANYEYVSLGGLLFGIQLPPISGLPLVYPPPLKSFGRGRGGKKRA